jgi:hypothetical protein
LGTPAFFFRAGRFLTYDQGEDAVVGAAAPAATRWHGLGPLEAGVDAALNYENGKLYLFRGNSYVRYDLDQDRVEPGWPKKIGRDDVTGQENWPGMARAKAANGRSFADGVDAALRIERFDPKTGKPVRKVYFFKGDAYVRYDVAQDRVEDGWPKRIGRDHVTGEENWPGMAQAKAADGRSFADGIDGAINWRNGKLYFFRGDAYLRYDLFDDRVDPGWPKKIGRDHVTGEENWPGMVASGFDRGVRAPFDVFRNDRELFLPGAERRPATSNGPAFVGLPWRAVLHTTEGTTVQGAIDEFAKHNSWPHLTVEPSTGRVIQHIPLTVGARSLGSQPGNPTNAANCIQIEIVGKAVASPQRSAADLEEIRRVMLQVEQLIPVPRRSGLQFLNQHGVNTRPANRLAIGAWQRFSGWCGHQHVPGNDHWDPGALNISALVSPNN